MTFFKLYAMSLMFSAAVVRLGVCSLPYGWAQPGELSPSGLAVCTAIQTQRFSPAASFPRSRVLVAKRENPIPAVTFCLCSGNIQGPYIKGRRQRGGSFNDSGGGEIMPSLLEGLFQVIILGLNPPTRLSHKHGNIEAAGVKHTSSSSSLGSHRHCTLILIGPSDVLIRARCCVSAGSTYSVLSTMPSDSESSSSLSSVGTYCSRPAKPKMSICTPIAL